MDEDDTVMIEDRPCFLCRFNHTPNARTLHTYMVENVGVSAPEHIATEMATTLQRLHPEADAESISKSMCLQHLKHHTLTPSIRLAMMLRSLLHLSDQMAVKLDRLEEDVEVKHVETYLKLQSQILTVYKTSDVNKLMFADRTT